LHPNRDGWVHDELRGLATTWCAGELKSTEHILISLVITRAEHKLSVRVLVQDTLDNLALVDGTWADFKVLLANENVNWSLIGNIVLQKVLTLMALEETPLGI